MPRCLRFLLWVAVGPHPAAAGKKNMDKRKTNRSHPCAAAGTPLTPTAPQPSMGGGAHGCPHTPCQACHKCIGALQVRAGSGMGGCDRSVRAGKGGALGVLGGPQRVLPQPSLWG